MSGARRKDAGSANRTQKVRAVDEEGAGDRLVRSETWHGLRAGDPVVVAGLKVRGAAWEFRAHVRNPRNGTESIEVIGGRSGDRGVRSFEPHRIYAVTGSRTLHDPRRSVAGRMSLAEAPQLPLA